MIFESLLSYLDGVRRTGEGRAMAKCPAHEDRSPSLLITRSGETVTLKCFAECPTDHVLGAIGWSFSDLYPDKLPDDTQAGRQTYFPAADVIQTLASEITFLHICASDLRRGEALNPEDYDRLLKAARRFEVAKEMIGR